MNNNTYTFETAEELQSRLIDVQTKEGIGICSMYVYLPNGERVSSFQIVTEKLSDGSEVQNIHFKQ